ncbi:acetyl-CoA carboxylase biotin carboxylase subunit [Amycolatopsis acidicola]|uniref:biotin carboxylase n=1 Tax=Amycolatopsis acidicola TaxID=2596893 RepID=A0A5N0VLW5_9PSEU|nr:biotin carboxylase N-terminal domain-containing protein [Amycolatopsis acidicola]KAA9166523.1 acetyl-CoA carboxylase biotin carboxylase subunit [Amycolatopsis acidicola]
MTGFDTVLIANRGEIALRVARTCRALGLSVVAVCSTADRDSAVTRLADRTVHIGPTRSSASYRNAAALIEAARMTGAQAIHPGYGFLSEDADFAEACAVSGLTFIGPSADVMRLLGEKSAARAAMAAAGLPLLPGAVEPVADATEATALAARIGYPVIIKAVAGGGGRGLRVVWRPGDLAAAFAETTANARALFADGRVYLERYLTGARHVEVQVLCDGHGNGVHLGVRDCSVQRRHQKLIEETPAPGLPAEVTGRMAGAALSAALETGYTGAGTFEFLVDGAGRFSFLEVNCRIQVEHPVTEEVTGVDLVAEQLRIAAGEQLSQMDITPRGAAVECRINAEDPAHGFAPAPGTLTEFAPPAGPFVRVDTHAFPGYRIPAAYDSLLAKVITWGPDRDTALARMRAALAEFRVAGPGIRTTADFLAGVLSDPRFVQARHDTRLLAGPEDGTTRSEPTRLPQKQEEQRGESLPRG